MATKKTTLRARKASPRARPRSARSSNKQRWKSLLVRLLSFARPHTLPETCALLLGLLALLIIASSAAATLIRAGTPSAGSMWAAALILGALIARFWPRLRRHVDGMTRDRARAYVGCFLLMYVVLGLSWHLSATSLGVGRGYLLPGPFDLLPGAALLLALMAALGVSSLLNLPLGRWGAALWRRGATRLDEARARRTLDRAEVSLPRLIEIEPPPEVEAAATASAQEEHAETRPPHRPRTPSEPARADPPPVDFNGRSLPPIDIFNPSPKGPASPADLELKGQRIQETLASFNVAARVVGYHCGPVVTQFDVQPERGVKVRRITELQNDLALALAAPTIRIQAPVPGKPVVGIEIPNSSASMVALRDLLESEAYTGSQALLKVALGKDVAGTPRIIDLTRMPHLLIAGATGSGKSACINAIISCLLYQSTPDQVRLMMIDPKMVELAVYNGVPHLLSPVVTQMDKVVGVLQWALREMERRYQLFADTTVRNIQRYNEKMESINAKKLPFIVVIVDELADLMMVAPEDVEDAICRLAQLARAAGIHLVIATQRPSVDVVTGLIKANFPARIAFAMTSQVDSRTILDTVGAEKLLGRGDMLYMPPDAPSTVRLQGAFLSEQEVERLVEFWQRSPLQAAVQRVSEDEFAAAEKAAAETGDELLDEATRVVREYQHASVSLLQRRLKVGYARAARLMDQLEARSVVGPADGSKQRRVLDQDLTGEE